MWFNNAVEIRVPISLFPFSPKPFLPYRLHVLTFSPPQIFFPNNQKILRKSDNFQENSLFLFFFSLQFPILNKDNLSEAEDPCRCRCSWIRFTKTQKSGSVSFYSQRTPELYSVTVRFWFLELRNPSKNRYFFVCFLFGLV